MNSNLIDQLQLKAITPYRKETSAWFNAKTDNHFALSNMAGGFEIYWPLYQYPANRWRTSEHLYQASKYKSDLSCLPKSKPDADPLVRNRIRQQSSGRGAKMTQKCVDKPEFIRSDWETDEIRIKTMLWVLELKLYWNPIAFSKELANTGNLPIVELISKERDTKNRQRDKTDIWGAVDQGNGELLGYNVLGKLLTHLRSRTNEVKQKHFTYPEGFLLT